MKHEWYLGLDIGSASVGFAATDTQYNILTKGGKLQCGARLFKEAQDASTRRGFRSSRRRFARRKVRIDLLQSLFDSGVAEKDPSFFIRLNESNRRDEDKTMNWEYPLFNDVNFTDRDYYKKFPTMYHLRKHLLENEERDVRLLYLACHNLIKYRGHFLFSEFNTTQSNDSYKDIIDKINERLDDDLAFSNEKLDGISSILADKSKSSTKQWYEIGGILNPHKNKRLDSILTAMKGNNITLSKIWNTDELKEAEQELKTELKDFKFSETAEKYDECLSYAKTIIDGEQLYFLELLKSFYGLVQLNCVIKGYSSIPEAMVARYTEHKCDLKMLKKFIKEHLPNEYDSIFRENGIYSNYIGRNVTHNTPKDERRTHCETCNGKGKPNITISYKDFLNKIEKIIEIAKNCDGYAELDAKIKNKTLCRIHNTQDNSYIPHQLQKAELLAILQKQSHFGLDVDKIVSLLTFRIPHYVGVLSEKHSDKFAWIVKNEGFVGERVLPWNFEEVVDTASSGEQFITRMTAKCTYLKSEDVIPKQSLLYQWYMLLNDLNNLKISGNRISQELKLFLLGSICQTEKSLTKAKIKKFLVEQGKITEADTVGNENDTAFNSSLSSLIKFRDILGNDFDLQMCEKIIMWHTVFGDEKKPVKQQIKSAYGTQLSGEIIDKLSKLTFNGWARFSRKFLSGIITTDKSTGESTLTIMSLLENTTLNLMEILNSDSYTPKFIDTVTSENEGDDVKLDYDGLVANLYCSPIVKRSIWQAILICKELAKINGCPPTKVFIEVTRGEDKSKKGKKTSSRREQIEELLNKAVKDCHEVQKMIDELNGKKDCELRSDRL